MTNVLAKDAAGIRQAMRLAETSLGLAGWSLKTAEIDLVNKTARIEVAMGSRYVTFDVRNGNASVTREEMDRQTIAVGRRGDRFRTERIRPRLIGRDKFTALGVRSAMRFFADYLDANGTGLLVGRQALALLLNSATANDETGQ